MTLSTTPSSFQCAILKKSGNGPEDEPSCVELYNHILLSGMHSTRVTLVITLCTAKLPRVPRRYKIILYTCSIKIE